MGKQSIYPECVTSDPSNGMVKLEVAVEFGEPRTISMVDDGTISEFQPDSRHMSQTGETTQLAVSSLPPFLIQLALPQDYPLHAPPNIISIRATYSWYSRLPELQKTLLEMWNGEGVLYDWIEHIRTGSFINCDSPNKPVQYVLLSEY